VACVRCDIQYSNPKGFSFSVIRMASHSNRFVIIQAHQDSFFWSFCGRKEDVSNISSEANRRRKGVPIITEANRNNTKAKRNTTEANRNPSEANRNPPK
jgi:hypothetical protein